MSEILDEQTKDWLGDWTYEAKASIYTPPKQLSAWTLGRIKADGKADFWFQGTEPKPNWFWRTMQYWILGITWKDI